MKVDTRAGSKELITPLRSWGVQVEEALLPAGDVEIVGNGPGGRPVLVGLEYKTLDDAITCMRDGRFADQLRKMRDYYEVNWLVVEGELRNTRPGQALDVRRHDRWHTQPSRVGYQELAAWLATMSQTGGVLLWRTRDLEETVAWVRAMELWWTAKDWEQHRAHLAFYQPPMGPGLIQPPLVQKVARVLPLIGEVKADRAAKFFRSVYNLVLAEPEEWAHIEGIGKRIANKVYEAIRAQERP